MGDPDPGGDPFGAMRDFHEEIPYLARHVASVGVTFAHPRRFFVNARATWRTRRFTDEANFFDSMLRPGWDVDLSFFWESPRKHWSVGLVVQDLLKDQSSTFYSIDVNARY